MLADSISPPEPGPNRPFALPPVPNTPEAKQTLVQPDIPPELQLKHDIPLPTVLLWEPPPPIRKKFVAPAQAERPRTMVEVPEAPELSAPNNELLTADLKIASMISTEFPRLFRPPASTAPLRGTAIQPISEPPLIATQTLTDTNLTALISLPDTPVISGQTVTIPPANQIAASGSSGSDGSGKTGTPGQPGNRGTRTGSSASAGAGSAPGTAGGSVSKSASAGQNSEVGAGDQQGAATQGAGSSLSGQSTLMAARSSASVGNGDDSGKSGRSVTGVDIDAQNRLIPGTTRISLPPDGKFAVTVTGSSLAAPYAESVGALSGKVIYSVYVGVGLRKKWILQYCLLKSDEQKTSTKGVAQKIDAPWPYQIIRPDNIGNSNRDYVIVHGLLTSEGRFGQLSLVFPTELPEENLLMDSLRQWTFRPATRDGVPSEVEVLLIIPSQTE
jgi:hypothetical protein